MKHSRDVQRSQRELREALKEQITLLTSYCEYFDKGERAFAKAMAVSLRVCLHHKNRSNSLLQQLGLRSGRFFTTYVRSTPRAMPIGCLLVSMSHSSETGGFYKPLLHQLTNKDRLPFPEWWTGTILRAPTGETMSRLDIVTAVADMDGGAHIDPYFDKTYAAFRSGRLLGMRITASEVGAITMHIPILSTPSIVASDPTEGLLVSPEYPTVRTIAHEFLLTLQKYAPWSFERSYEPPAE